MPIPNADQILTNFLHSQTPVATPENKIDTPKPETLIPAEKPVEATAPKVETPAPVAEPAKPEVPTEVEFDLDNWEKDEPVEAAKPEPVVTPTFDFSSFAKDAGFENIKTPEEFKQAVTSLKTKPSELEGLPDTLKRAVELAKKGGDYLSYLGVSKVDYSKIDPDQAFLQDAENRLGKEQARELYDSKSPIDRKLEGLRLLDGWQNWQRQQEASIEAQVAQAARETELRMERASQKLQDTLNKVDEIAGLKLKPSHKADIFDAITTGRISKELFFDAKTGEYDYKNMAETYFLKKNLPKIMDHLKSATASATKKAFIKELGNIQIDNKPSEKLNVEEDKRTQIEKLNDHFRSQYLGKVPKQ